MPRYNSKKLTARQERKTFPARDQERRKKSSWHRVNAVMDTRQRLTAKKQLHICFSGSGSKQIGFIKQTQKRVTPFLAAFCCLRGSVCHTHKYAGIDRKTRFHGYFCIWHIVFYVACGILWITTTIFTTFPGRSAAKQPKNMYLFKTQSKWNRNFDPDFLPSGFGVTSFFEQKFFRQKIPLKRAIFLGDFLKK